MAGKGDSPRPLTVTVDEFRRRFERTFEATGRNGTEPRDRREGAESSKAESEAAAEG